MLTMYSELRGILTEFATKGAEQARTSKTLLFSISKILSRRTRGGNSPWCRDRSLPTKDANGEPSLTASAWRPIRNWPQASAESVGCGRGGGGASTAVSMCATPCWSDCRRGSPTC